MASGVLLPCELRFSKPFSSLLLLPTCTSSRLHFFRAVLPPRHTSSGWHVFRAIPFLKGILSQAICSPRLTSFPPISPPNRFHSLKFSHSGPPVQILPFYFLFLQKVAKIGCIGSIAGPARCCTPFALSLTRG